MIQKGQQDEEKLQLEGYDKKLFIITCHQNFITWKFKYFQYKTDAVK